MRGKKSYKCAGKMASVAETVIQHNFPRKRLMPLDICCRTFLVRKGMNQLWLSHHHIVRLTTKDVLMIVHDDPKLVFVWEVCSGRVALHRTVLSRVSRPSCHPERSKLSPG